MTRQLQLTSSQRNLLLAAVVWTLAAVALTATAPTADKVAMSVAAVIDIALLGGGALWWTAKRHGGFGALGVRWRTVARACGFTVVLAVVALRLGGVPVSGLLLLPVLAIEGAIAALVTRELVAGFRGTSADRPILDRVETALGKILPAAIAGAAVGELRLLSSVGRWLRRAPLGSRSEWQFTATETSNYGQVVVTMLLLSCVEVPAVHLLLAMVTESVAAQTALLVVHLYGIAWLVGDWRTMRESAHTVGDDALELRLGGRWSATIPYDRIVAVRCETLERDILGSNEKEPDTVMLTPFDAPNVYLELSEPLLISTYFGFGKRASRLRLFVDEPTRFVDRVRGRTAIG